MLSSHTLLLGYPSLVSPPPSGIYKWEIIASTPQKPVLSSAAPVHYPGEENSYACCEVGPNHHAPVDSESFTVSKDIPPVELVGGPPGVEE